MEYALIYTDVPVFDNEEQAKYYMETGDMSGATVQPSKQYNADEIYLDNFCFEVHDSNKLENYYIDVFYEPSQYLLDNMDNAYIDVTYTYNRSLEGVFGAYKNDYEPTVTKKTYALSDIQNGFKEDIYYLDCIMSYINDGSPGAWAYEDISERQFLGSEFIVDWEILEIEGVEGSLGASITKSYLDVEIVPRVENTLGYLYGGKVDFLTNDSRAYSSCPDTSGNYEIEQVKNNEGYYYTDVGSDEHGNPTYNYYYIDSSTNTSSVINGSSGGSGGGSGTGIQHHYHEHKWEGSVNVNVNGSFGGGSSSGDNVTIEDDDLSADGLRSAIEDGYGLFDLVSTEKDNDGFLSLLTAFMGSLDDDMSNLIGFGMGTTVALALLLRLLNR